MVLLIYFAFLFCIIFPLGEATRITPGLTISFTLLELTVVAGSLVWLGKQLLEKKYPMSLQAKTFSFVAIVFVLSLAINSFHLSIQQIATSGLYILRWFCFGIIFFMVKNSSTSLKKKLSWILLIGGSVLMASGFVQYFFYPSLRNLIYFGWDEHFYRMFGTFFDPNFFGLFLVLFFLFSLSQTFSFVKKKAFFIPLSIITGATFFGIFLTYSRTALFALVCGVIILLWNKPRFRNVLFICFGIGLVVLVVMGLSRPATNTNTIFRTTSIDARVGSDKDALVIFQDNPLIGIGFNAYRYSMYRHHFQSGLSAQQDHGASGVDSSLLLVLATSGIVGLAAFSLFLWSHFRALHSSSLGLATLVAFFVGSFFVNGLFYPFLLIWVWAVLGITESDVR